MFSASFSEKKMTASTKIVSPTQFVIEMEDKACHELNDFLAANQTQICEEPFIIYDCKSKQHATFLEHLANHFSWNACCFENNDKWAILINNPENETFNSDVCDCGMSDYLQLVTFENLQNNYLRNVDNLLNGAIKKFELHLFNRHQVEIQNISANYVEILLRKLVLWKTYIKMDKNNDKLFHLSFALV